MFEGGSGYETSVHHVVYVILINVINCLGDLDKWTFSRHSILTTVLPGAGCELALKCHNSKMCLVKLKI